MFLFEVMFNNNIKGCVHVPSFDGCRYSTQRMYRITFMSYNWRLHFYWQLRIESKFIQVFNNMVKSHIYVNTIYVATIMYKLINSVSCECTYSYKCVEITQKNKT